MNKKKKAGEKRNKKKRKTENQRKRIKLLKIYYSIFYKGHAYSNQRKLNSIHKHSQTSIRILSGFQCRNRGNTKHISIAKIPKKYF